MSHEGGYDVLSVISDTRRLSWIQGVNTIVYLHMKLLQGAGSSEKNEKMVGRRSRLSAFWRPLILTGRTQGRSNRMLGWRGRCRRGHRRGTPLMGTRPARHSSARGAEGRCGSSERTNKGTEGHAFWNATTTTEPCLGASSESST